MGFSSSTVTVNAIQIFMMLNDERNKDAEIIGVLYRSETLTGQKTLVGQGSPVTPFTNWSFSGLKPNGHPIWVNLPMPPGLELPTGTTGDASVVYWLGMLASKDSTCFGLPKSATNPSLGPGAVDSFAATPFAGGAPANLSSWTVGGWSFSAFATLA